MHLESEKFSTIFNRRGRVASNVYDKLVSGNHVVILNNFGEESVGRNTPLSRVKITSRGINIDRCFRFRGECNVYNAPTMNETTHSPVCSHRNNGRSAGFTAYKRNLPLSQ